MTAQEYIITLQQHPFFFCFPAASFEFSFTPFAVLFCCVSACVEGTELYTFSLSGTCVVFISSGGAIDFSFR